eukprot:ANDGO_05853.mRNA.1 Pre-mRNA cleavage factor Im 25 kDa subunit 2
MSSASASAQHVSSYDIYDVRQYAFSYKDAQPEKDTSVAARMARHRELYYNRGARRTVEALLIVHVHQHPHVLVLQIGNTFFKLPGGRCRPDESEHDCLYRKLTKRLGPPSFANAATTAVTAAAEDPIRRRVSIGELVAVWYRPNFENLMYPYCPPHITSPKEVRKLYICALPASFEFHVPRNFKMFAVPLFHLYDNPKRYGSHIAKIPEALSRFHFNRVPFHITQAAPAAGDAIPLDQDDARQE